MESHILELKSFDKESVQIRFLWGNQEHKKKAYIRHFSGSRLLIEGLNDASGRQYRIPYGKIIEIKSLENDGKIWRKAEDDRL